MQERDPSPLGDSGSVGNTSSRDDSFVTAAAAAKLRWALRVACGGARAGLGSFPVFRVSPHSSGSKEWGNAGRANALHAFVNLRRGCRGPRERERGAVAAPMCRRKCKLGQVKAFARRHAAGKGRPAAEPGLLALGWHPTALAVVWLWVWDLGAAAW